MGVLLTVMLSEWWIAVSVVSCVSVSIVLWRVYVYFLNLFAVSPLWYPNEQKIQAATTSQLSGSLEDPPSIDLSIIVPAFNEEQRLGKMLDETLAWLQKREALEQQHFTYEVLIVDDGSTDTTSALALQYSTKHKAVRVLSLLKNRGKGGAVKRGALCARGKYLLMADADGATEISDLEKVERELLKVEIEGLGIGIGSRAHLEEAAIATRSPLRNVLMYGFHMLVKTLCVKQIQDTQCGFKLFTRKTAQLLFKNLHVERWAFDVELLYLANRLKVPMVEVAVNWTEVEGSKLSPFAASIQMAKDLVRIRIAYTLGFWSIVV